jgi:general nucleoside transport system ATP-binding protein
MSEAAPLLELRGIDKRFGPVHANRAVDLTLHHREVLGLLGENGAGKTTLMNILFGLYRADAGQIRVEGRPVTILSPADALAAGIGMVHQHFHLVDRHSVLENLMVGEPGRRGLLDRNGARARLAEIGERYGLRLEPDRAVASLSVGEQQRLEIVKAL